VRRPLLDATRAADQAAALPNDAKHDAVPEIELSTQDTTIFGYRNLLTGRVRSFAAPRSQPRPAGAAKDPAGWGR
jgi:hypothetical protein